MLKSKKRTRNIAAARGATVMWISPECSRTLDKIATLAIEMLADVQRLPPHVVCDPSWSTDRRGAYLHQLTKEMRKLTGSLRQSARDSVLLIQKIAGRQWVPPADATQFVRPPLQFYAEQTLLSQHAGVLARRASAALTANRRILDQLASFSDGVHTELITRGR